METFTLNDSNQIPKLGIGVNQVRSAGVGPALARAFEVGYRAVDTANTYLNERAVGQAVRDSGLPRKEVVPRAVRDGRGGLVPARER